MLKGADDELPTPAPVDSSPRRVSAPELVASADDALVAFDLDRAVDDSRTLDQPRLAR